MTDIDQRTAAIEAAFREGRELFRKGVKPLQLLLPPDKELAFAMLDGFWRAFEVLGEFE